MGSIHFSLDILSERCDDGTRVATSSPLRNRIQALHREYASLRPGRESLLAMIEEVEIPESVYNSNAIENSTLTLEETEKILLEQMLSRNVSVREVFEAVNLARVIEYQRKRAEDTDLGKERILLLHQMLIGAIDDDIAGRFRRRGEYVRVGTHIAPAPEQVEGMIEETLLQYASDLDSYFLDRIARFHLDFEVIHPFCDGNGRVGRVIINAQLQKLGLPPLIIRNSEKQTYYRAFREYTDRKRTATMERILALALLESLHKRRSYLLGQRITTLSDYIRKEGESAPAVTNAARRQTIPAFREKGVWKIGQ
jgi:Fic family protein